MQPQGKKKQRGSRRSRRSLFLSTAPPCCAARAPALPPDWFSRNRFSGSPQCVRSRRRSCDAGSCSGARATWAATSRAPRAARPRPPLGRPPSGPSSGALNLAARLRGARLRETGALCSNSVYFLAMVSTESLPSKPRWKLRDFHVTPMYKTPSCTKMSTAY